MDYEILTIRSCEYRRFKRILNRAGHPTFIGRSSFETNAREGGAVVLTDTNKRVDVAAALMKTRTHTLMALSVIKSYQGMGIGGLLIDYMMPHWVRALESKIGYFEKLGYVSVGEMKIGRSLNTQIMVRSNLLLVAGRVSRILNSRNIVTDEDGEG